MRIRIPNTSIIALTGTEEFQSEAVVAYEMGFRTRIGERLSLDTAVFDNRYNELRSQEFPTAPGTPVRLMNLLNAVTRGAEITAKAQLTALVADRRRLHLPVEALDVRSGEHRSHWRRRRSQ